MQSVPIFERSGKWRPVGESRYQGADDSKPTKPMSWRSVATEPDERIGTTVSWKLASSAEHRANHCYQRGDRQLANYRIARPSQATQTKWRIPCRHILRQLWAPCYIRTVHHKAAIRSPPDESWYRPLTRHNATAHIQQFMPSGTVANSVISAPILQ